MKILDGLDTQTQAAYGFSRYVLGPFQPTPTYPAPGTEGLEVAIRAAYRQLFGNAYLMEEERAELAVPESQFKMGTLTAREFVRACAKSTAYKTRFFEGASQYRFIELNFMHLLGRAPDSQQEIAEHVANYCAHGVDADIDSYIDSAEYASVFGDDNIPFLRFRGAYTPCESFNKQCALKGGWANSDKAMGGAALSGYNGSDGKQFCDRIAAYATSETTPYEHVAENTPLKTTAPNWYAVPDPALPPTPAFVSQAEVSALQRNVKALQAQYDIEVAKRSNVKTDQLAPFREMAADLGSVINRGVAFAPGDPLMLNPYAKVMGTDESALAEAGCKSSDYKRFHKQMENDTLSRIEKDLEEAKSALRVLSKALDASTPLTPDLLLPGQVPEAAAAASLALEDGTARPRVSVTRRAPVPAAASVAKVGPKVGPVQLPALPDLPKVELPKVGLPKVSLPKVSLPFGKKEE